MTTITIDRELLEQALVALSAPNHCVFSEPPICVDIRAALSAPATAPEPSTEVAVGKLCKSLREDLDYAWTWHCNIAMAAFDAGCPHDVANEGAARFMQLLAGVDTREHPAFQGTQDHPMRNDKTAPAQPDQAFVCSLGCTTECLARQHGVPSECPSLPRQPVITPATAQAAEIARLRSESEERLQNCAALVAEVERLRKDAERYQWLAEYLVSDDESYDDAIVAATTVKEVDSVIDNAMKGTP